VLFVARGHSTRAAWVTALSLLVHCAFLPPTTPQSFMHIIDTVILPDLSGADVTALISERAQAGGCVVMCGDGWVGGWAAYCTAVLIEGGRGCCWWVESSCLPHSARCGQFGVGPHQVQGQPLQLRHSY